MGLNQQIQCFDWVGIQLVTASDHVVIDFLHTSGKGANFGRRMTSPRKTIEVSTLQVDLDGFLLNKT